MIAQGPKYQAYSVKLKYQFYRILQKSNSKLNSNLLLKYWKPTFQKILGAIMANF